ncbi:MAG: metal-sulfur cluster assembly factor [Phormidesmis sp. FL-bin-119]|nr:metal-sulfur cluster assembly factor [Pedobacter sp.]
MKNPENIQEKSVSKTQVVAALGLIIDPELGINIVDMGLLYSVDIDELGKSILINLTLSSRGCPMGAAILGGAENILKSYFPRYVIEVQLVWEPAWTPEFISEDGRQLLD